MRRREKAMLCIVRGGPGIERMRHRGTSSPFSVAAVMLIGCSASVITFSTNNSAPPTGRAGGGGSVTTSSTGPFPVVSVASAGGAAGASTGSGGGAGSEIDAGAGTDVGSSDSAPIDDASGGSLIDANDDFNYAGLCIVTRPDSGNPCRDECICSQCAAQADPCNMDPLCRNLTSCAFRAGCVDVSYVSCTQAQCTSELSELVEAGTASILSSGFLLSCYSARCSAMCESDARSSDSSRE
jgi:hypothetical protein